MKRNKFNKALKHLKSKKVDDKIKKLEEAAPTNSMSGVYQVSPSAGDAFRLGQPDAPKRFYTKGDGTWPTGIPGDPNKVFYDRPAGYWGSGRNTTPEVGEPTKRDFTYADVTANGNTNTDQFIRPSDGKVYTALPEGSENFILGPLVTSYAINHGYDDYTNLGYIQKDTRQFVLLARIQGFFKGEDRPRTSYLSHGNIARTWDGTASQLTIYNSNFTLEYALWMKDKYEKGNFTSNFPFRFAGGIPVDRHPDDSSMGGGDIMGTDDGQQSKDGDTSGTEQDAPDDNDIESLDLWGILKRIAGELGVFGADPVDYLSKLGMKGFFQLGKLLAPFTGTETAYGMANAFGHMSNHYNNNNPIHPDFRKHDPTSDNYVGPKDIQVDPKTGYEITQQLDLAISNLNNGNGPTNANGNLTDDEIKKVSDHMNDPFRYEGNTDSWAVTFYNTLHSLPPDVTTVKVKDGKFESLDSNYVFSDPRDANPIAVDEKIYGNASLTNVLANFLTGIVTQATGNGKPKGDGGQPFYRYSVDEVGRGSNNEVIGTQYNTQSQFSRYNKPKGQDLNFTTMSYVPDGEVLSERKRILREIKQPVLIEATPKTTKLKGYRPNFKGKYSPQNTPDVTASKKSDEAVEGYNTSRLAWTNKDKFWKGYETTERMNVIFDRVGFGKQYFDRVVAENILGNKKMQEHFNILSHEKAMRDDDPNYRSPFRKIDEQETYDDKVKDPLFGKVAKKLKKEIDYPDKPAKAGYPNEAPVKVDPMTGYHPKYGKRYKYDKLDPVSAVMMSRAPTGDPEIDANVKKTAKQKKDHSNIDKRIDEWFFEKRKRDWRKEIDEGMTTANLVTDPYPATGLDLVINDTPTISADAFADAPARQDTEPGFSYPAMVGTNIKSSGTGVGDNGGFNIGDHIAFDGEGSTGGARWAVLKPADTTKVDTIVINAIVGNGSNGGEKPDDPNENLNLYYKTDEMNDYIPINYYPTYTNEGQKSDDVNMNLIPLNVPDSYSNNVNIYALTIPEYARTPNTRFLFYQFNSSGSGRDKYGITSVSYRRFQPMNVVVPLDSPDAISFINVGTNEGDPKKRKKKVDDMLKASDEYTEKQMGGEFPGQGSRLGDDPDPFAPAPILSQDGSPIGKDAVKKSFSDFAIDAADSETDTSQSEPESPSTQVTLEPKDEDGNEIPVKPVGKIAVQGADAAKLEAEAETEAETEEEPKAVASSVEKPEEPEMEPEPEDEEEKKNWLQRQVDKFIDPLVETLDDIIFKLDDVAGVGDLLGWLSNTVFTTAGGFFQLLNAIPEIFHGFKIPDYIAGGSSSGKYHNSVSIFRSITSGKVVNHVPTYPELQLFRKFITPDLFKEGSTSFVPISDIRHEYADENIYVKDGKVYNNRNEKATDLTYGKEFGRQIDYGGSIGPEGIGAHGTGYAQMIIPKDGGKPYLHYYDYNYHNLQNEFDLPVGIGKDQSFNISEIGSNTAHLLMLLTKVPHGGIQRSAALASERFMKSFKNLANTDSMLGGNWPPGIHGAALTDFKVPFDELPEETQKYIAMHPLSWTDERVANMSDDYLYEQVNLLLDREKIIYQESDKGKSYLDKIGKILKSREANVDPKFAKAFADVNDQYFERLEKYEELQNIYKKPEAGLAETKSREDWRALQEEQREATRKEELHKKFSKGVKIPNPETDGDKFPSYDEWVKGDEKEYDELIAQQDKFAKDAQIYYKTTTQPAFDKALEYENSLKKEGDKVVGTKEQIAKFRKLVAEYEKTSNEYDRLFALQDEPMIKAGELLAAFQDDYNRRMEVWKPYNKELDRVYREVNDMYQDLVDEAYTKYQMTMGEKNKDGVYEYVNGGDYTDPSGKTYAGLGTLTKSVQDEIDEIDLLMKENGDILGSFDPRYMEEKISQYFVNKPYKGKNTNWSPEKKGKGDGRDGGSSFGPGGDFTGGDATAAATAAADRRRRRRNQGFNESNLFERLKTSPFFNPKDIKPTFPEKPPGQIDPKTGMHSEYGKQAGRYKRLDPISANAMPKTGDPETDAVVAKQKTKRTLKKIKEVHNEKHKVLK
mgnify:CR=1 FL=1